MVENTPPRKATATSMRAAIREGRLGEVVEALRPLPPLRRAELFVQLRPSDQKAALSAAPPDLQAAILADSDNARLVGSLTAMDLASLAGAFNLIPPDNLADLVLRLPRLRRTVLSSCSIPRCARTCASSWCSTRRRRGA